MYHGEFLKENSLLSVSGAVRDVGAFGTLSKCGNCRSLGVIAFCSSECDGCIDQDPADHNVIVKIRTN